MLVSTNSPLPQNSTSPWPGMSQDMQSKLAAMGAAVLKAQHANRCPAPPASFMDLGANVVTDVALTQAAAQAAATSGVANTPSSLASGETDYFNGPEYGYYGPGVSTSPSTNPNNPAIANAPVITGFPGSYGPGTGGRNANANGCTSAPAPAPAPPPSKPQMPVMLPAVTSPPTPPIAQPLRGAPPPAWKNLCWALRNGWVNQSQFKPAEYNALDYACSTLGYTGACPANANVAMYLNMGVANGSLPHISVSPSDIAALPQAPPLTGVSCPQSIAMGMAGVAPSWSSAFGGSCAQYMKAQANAPGGSSWLFWAGIAAAGFGLYELFKKGN